MSSPGSSGIECGPDNFVDLWNDSGLLNKYEKLTDVQPDFLIASDDEESAEVVLSSIPASMQHTPGKENQDALISSPQFCTPYASASARLFASCSESPIDLCLVAASTPFQGQRISSNSSAVIETNKKCNMTYECKPEKALVAVNETFNASSHRLEAGDGTFIKDNKNVTFCKDGNATFDTKPAEKDSGSDIMESCTTLESSSESCDGKPKRKPLTAIPQPKTTSTARTGVKKISRLAAPRMNTAAISRIQARSPGGASNQNDSDMMKPPRKTVGSSTRARKSLLPPSNISKSSSLRKPAQNSGSAMLTEPSKPRQEGNVATPTKRKAQESPKRVGRSPKISGNRSTAPLRPPTNLRSSSAPISRLTSVVTRTSRLQRPSALKTSSSTRPSAVSSVNKLPDKRSTITSLKLQTKNGAQSSNVPQKSNTVAMATLTSSGNLRKPRPEKKTKGNNAECITGLAILLDYVVNKLDGLSAPRLSEEKQQLQQLVCDKKEANESLSTRLGDLERDFKEANESHARDLEEERRCREEVIAQLESEREKCRLQITSLQLQQEEMRTSHEAEVVQLKDEWSSECQKLHDTMESQIQEELKERIKPYVNAKSEVESLSAVLDLKNDTIHKLEAQSSSFDTQRDEMLTLQYKVERLEQKNEDLSMQLHEKTEEQRNVVAECDRLRRSLNEEHNRSMKLYQQNEELVYRLNSVSPSPSSSFNPVFTTSPTVSDPPVFGPMGSTPLNTGMRRVAFAKSSSSSKTDDQTNDILPRSLSYNNNTENNLNHSL